MLFKISQILFPFNKIFSIDSKILPKKQFVVNLPKGSQKNPLETLGITLLPIASALYPTSS